MAKTEGIARMHEMKKIMKYGGMAIVVMMSGMAVMAEPSGDRPDATHAWAVHDVNRPNPVKVTVPQGGIPSDATLLFDGTEESVVRNWRAKDGSACKWTVKNGELTCVPGAGCAFTREDFGDCQIHVEWKIPTDDRVGEGNSGVLLMGCYELQIQDAFDIKPSRSPWKITQYADGQAGAVYGQHPPLVNPCRKRDEWQSYDIVFHPPYREDGKLVDPGSVTLFFNGVLVQDAWPFEGKICWCRRASEHPETSTGPLRLQDHGHPVAFRNIWLRRIPSRYAETTCGGPGVKRADVAALRHRLAGESLRFADETDDPAEKFVRLWEAYCYEPDDALTGRLDAAAASCVAAIRANDRRLTGLARFHAVKRFVKMLVAGKWMKKDSELEKLLDGWTPPPKPKEGHLRDI